MARPYGRICTVAAMSKIDVVDNAYMWERIFASSDIEKVRQTHHYDRWQNFRKVKRPGKDFKELFKGRLTVPRSFFCLEDVPSRASGTFGQQRQILAVAGGFCSCLSVLCFICGSFFFCFETCGGVPGENFDLQTSILRSKNEKREKENLIASTCRFSIFFFFGGLGFSNFL